MKNIFSLIVILSLIIISCKNREKVFLKSYKVDDVSYSCEDYYILRKLVKEICYYPTGDTISIINYNENKKSGDFKEFYNNNKVKTNGQFSSNNKIGLWRQYYENSILKTVLLYIESEDTTELVYKKEYHENGNLKACILPIDLSTNNSNLEYKIGYTYQLYIKLKYSIHEKCKISGELFDYSSNQDVKLCNSKDPLILICEFTPCSKGDHFIKGEIFEYEGIKDDEKYSGVTMFDFKYKASKQ